MPQTQLWELATYDIKPRLNRLSGVASVLVQGGQEPEFHVTVDPSRMLRAQRRRSSDILGGHQPHQHHRLAGTAESQPSAVPRAGHARRCTAPEDIGNIVIKSVNNVPVRVQDIGDVAPAVAPVYTAVSANGKPAVLLSVNRQPDSNTVQVADEVHQEMADIRPTLAVGRRDASVLRPVRTS